MRADDLAPILYVKLGALGIPPEALTKATLDLSRRLSEEIEARCEEAARMGLEVRLAVSPLQREGMGFVHRFAFIEDRWISPEYAGWMIYGPFPPAQRIETAEPMRREAAQPGG